MIPITRKEHYLNRIVGNNEYETPEKPIIEEEFFFAEILGEAVQAPEPLTRYQMYLAKIAGRNIEIPYPEVRLEYFLARAAGMEIETPTPITREEMFWADYALIVEKELSGIPPLTFNAVAGTLKNYRIYGNTVDGESVGDRTGNLFDENSDSVSGYIDDNGNISQGANPITTYDYINVTPSENYYIKICGETAALLPNRKIRIAYYSQNKRFLCRVILERVDNGATFETLNNCYYIRLSIDDGNTDIMLNEGSTPLSYEPYGYKVPVTVSNGTDAQTIPIYLSEQIRKVGDEAEYIDFGEQKQYFADGTSIDITLPALPTLSGTNTLTVGTEVQPSNVYIKYEGER